jgi:replicative DNA helicase/uncharacterized protein YfkK (UPF0435 family)
MLTEQFLNLSCVCLLKDNINFKGLEDDVLYILNFYETKYPNQSISIKNKFDVIKKICELKKTKMSSDAILDSIISTKKYGELEEFLNVVNKKVLNIEDLEKAKEQIILRKRLLNVVQKLPELSSFVDKFESNMFDDLGTAVDEFEEIISDTYKTVSDIKRKDRSKKTESFDALSDDYDGVLNQIRTNYSGVESVPTGYVLLDKYLKGGMQPKRVYIVGGSSGDGKSTLLLNIINNIIHVPNKKESVLEVYVYITLENHIDETLVRLYCCGNELDEEKVMKNFDTERVNIKRYFKDLLFKNNKILKLYYCTPGETGIEEILCKINDIKSEYKNSNKEVRIKGIFIDYLDLLKSGRTFDLYRLELGQITTDLKLLSVITEAPVLSPTQLNRQGYDKEKRKDLTMMGESIKKVENADCIMLVTFKPDEKQEGSYDVNSETAANVIFQEGKGAFIIDIGKNRNGIKNKAVFLRADFAKYLIKDTSMKHQGIQEFVVDHAKTQQSAPDSIL